MRDGDGEEDGEERMTTIKEKKKEKERERGTYLLFLRRGLNLRGNYSMDG